MKIFIDFDDVIFNTKEFKTGLRTVFSNQGIPAKWYDKTYYGMFDTGLIKMHDPDVQITELKKVCNFNKDDLARKVADFMKDAPSFVFSDVCRFIGAVRAENISILSYGNKLFQEKKITCSGIGKKVSHVYVTDVSKVDVLSAVLQKEKILSSEQVFFIDDRLEQIQGIKEMFPGIVTILLTRPEGRYQEMRKDSTCDFEARNLGQVGEIIKKYEYNFLK